MVVRDNNVKRVVGFISKEHLKLLKISALQNDRTLQEEIRDTLEKSMDRKFKNNNKIKENTETAVNES